MSTSRNPAGGIVGRRHSRRLERGRRLPRGFQRHNPLDGYCPAAVAPPLPHRLGVNTPVDASTNVDMDQKRFGTFLLVE